MAEIERRSLASIRPIDVLRLVDLTGDGPLRMGVPSDVVGARDQSQARQWWRPSMLILIVLTGYSTCHD